VTGVKGLTHNNLGNLTPNSSYSQIQTQG